MKHQVFLLLATSISIHCQPIGGAKESKQSQDGVQSQSCIEVEKPEVFLSNFDFCPANIENGNLENLYFQNFLHEYGLTREQVESQFDPTRNLNKVYSKQDQSKIELKVHRIYLANPDSPQEMFFAYSDPRVFSRVKATSDLIEPAPGTTWKYTLWTNDVSLIPKTVAWFKYNRFQIRQISELPEDSFITQRVNTLIKENNFAAAADLLKVYILLNEGGIYLDMKVYLEDFVWDWMNLFDSVFVKDTIKQGTVTDLSHSVFHQEVLMFRSQHPVLLRFLELYKHQAAASSPAANFRSCVFDKLAQTPLETFSNLFSIAYALDANQPGLSDIVIRTTSQEKYQQEVKTSTFYTSTLKLKVSSQPSEKKQQYLAKLASYIKTEC